MRKYWAFYLGNIQNTLTFRGPLFVWLIGSILSLVTVVAVWFSATGGQTFGGFSRREIVSYFVLVTILQWVTSWMPFYWLKDEIKDGSIVGNTLVKPVSLIGKVFASEAGWHTISIPIGLSIGIITILYLGNFFVFSLSGFNIVLFFIALVQSIFITCTLSICMGLMAFWFTNVNTLDGLYWSLRFIIGGQVIPVSFLSGALSTIAFIFPFRYTLSFPLEIYFNKLEPTELTFGFLVSTLWCIFSFILYRFMYSRGIRAYSSFGN